MQNEARSKLSGYTDRDGVIHIHKFQRAAPPSTADALKSIAKNLLLLVVTVLVVLPFVGFAWLFFVGLPRLQKLVR